MTRSSLPAGPEPIELASRDEIEALQLARLVATLNHAYANVDHYRRTFDEAGVHPREVSGLAELARFPFTTKADLRANYPWGMLAVDRRRLARIHARLRGRRGHRPSSATRLTTSMHGPT